MAYTPSLRFALEGPPPPEGIEPDDWYRSPLARIAYEAFSQHGQLLFAMPLGKIADEVSLMQTSAEHVGDLASMVYAVANREIRGLITEYMDSLGESSVAEDDDDVADLYSAVSGIVSALLSHIIEWLNENYVIIHREYELLGK